MKRTTNMKETRQMAIEHEEECGVCSGTGFKAGTGTIDGIGAEACGKCKGRGFYRKEKKAVGLVPSTYVAPVQGSDAPVSGPLAGPFVMLSGQDLTLKAAPGVPKGEVWILDASTGTFQKIKLGDQP
jgi:hypothetical protein